MSSFTIENHGTIVLVRPLDADVNEWLHEHTDGQWMGNALAVEPRYVEDLVLGLEGEGFVLASVREAMASHPGDLPHPPDDATFLADHVKVINVQIPPPPKEVG
jgi:hypothetical protein